MQPVRVVTGPAPDSFRVAFETNRGNFVVAVNRSWAPNGADRFYQLAASHFFDEQRLIRIIRVLQKESSNLAAADQPR